MVDELKVTVRLNHGRLNSLKQEGRAALRKARKGDRPAIEHRYYMRAVRECMTVTGGVPRVRK